MIRRQAHGRQVLGRQVLGRQVLGSQVMRSQVLGSQVMRRRVIGRQKAGLLLHAVAEIRDGRFQRPLAAAAAAGAAVTAAEIFSEHDSASFGNKMMWWPIVVVPTIVPAGIAAVFSAKAARTVLPVASALVVANGVQGTYLHWRGILQKPGGASNLRYNIEMGPPMFAPLLASMVGGMGLLASLLRRESVS